MRHVPRQPGAIALSVLTVSFASYAGAGVTAAAPGQTARRATSSESRLEPRPSPLVTRGRKALAAGRIEEAARLSEEALKQTPADAAAARLRIDTLLRMSDRAAALDAYEQFGRAAKKEDDRLLAPIARAELEALAGDAVPMVQVAATERLARLGDAKARQALADRTRREPDAAGGRAATEALARLGDVAAARRLTALAASGPAAVRIPALVALARSGAAERTAAVQSALEDLDPVIRAAAADAAGMGKVTEARGRLKRLLDDRSFLVRLSAAAALKRLGDTAGDALLGAALASELPDARLMAAQGFIGASDRSWVPAIRPLLQNRDGLNRLRAADMLLPIARADAYSTLAEAAEDPNPSVRSEAARILASHRAEAPALMRRLLRDQAAMVRLFAAEALVAR